MMLLSESQSLFSLSAYNKLQSLSCARAFRCHSRELCFGKWLFLASLWLLAVVWVRLTPVCSPFSLGARYDLVAIVRASSSLPFSRDLFREVADLDPLWFLADVRDGLAPAWDGFFPDVGGFIESVLQGFCLYLRKANL